MAFLTFVTTCRGRLAHLRETLPSLAAQPDARVVVVDYGCPDDSGRWVETHFPQVEVVRSAESTRFELARARNLGAPSVGSPWICFIDADTGVADDFCEQIRPLLAAGRFYQAVPRTIETWGTSICAKTDFERVGGYDEVIQGWGREDDDFYTRLHLAGIRQAKFPGELLHVISHTDDQRVAHYDVKNRWVSESINHVYCRAKIDLMLLQQAPPALDVRKQLYAKVHAAVTAARGSGKPLAIEVPFRTEDTRACGPLQVKLTYTLPQPLGDGQLKSTRSFITRPRQRRPQ
jgi:glycosyltransferase involved in cell wall biosynthesis